MELTKHKRVTGPARDEIAAQLRKDYENGTTPGPRRVQRSVVRVRP